jgi:phosphatidylserine decarboxylase
MAKTLKEWINTDVKQAEKMSIEQLSNQFFFRDPLRTMYIDNEHFYSPADGTILYQKVINDPTEPIVEIKGINYTLQDAMGDKDYNKPSLVIGIFMSFYDPHIIRIPYGGVIDYEYLEAIESTNKPMLATEKDIFNGKINPANLEYLKNNERMKIKINSLSLEYQYNMCLIADEDVNVISSFKKQQDICSQNDRFGLVRWGSQTELILPLDKRFDFELCQEDHTHVEAGLDKLIKIKWK